MKATLFKQAIMLSVFLLISSAASLARNNNNLVYNTEEKDGVVTSQLVYKMDNGQLSNYEKFNYTYDNDKRMKTQEKQIWNSNDKRWENSVCIQYTYQNGKKNIEYQKWNAAEKTYVLVPEMSISVDDTESIQ